MSTANFSSVRHSPTFEKVVAPMIHMGYLHTSFRHLGHLGPLERHTYLYTFPHTYQSFSIVFMDGG